MSFANRLLLIAALIALVATALPPDAAAYNFWRQYNGRQDWETGGFYDLNDEAWAVPAGAALTDRFAFDWSIVFPAVGPFANAAVQATWKTESTSAISDWARWANIKLGAEKADGTGHVRFTFKNGGGTDISPSVGDPVTHAPINYDFTKAEYWDRPYINPMTGNPDPAAVPVAAQIRYSALHEFGHALGLDDLHSGAPYSEEFVDHRLMGNRLPDREGNNVADPSRNDNIMQGCSSPANDPGGVCDYSHNPVIDNDEIAAAAWLWGGPTSQIVTGDLKASWNNGTLGGPDAGGLGGRDTIDHHGDQNTPPGWWTYRGSLGQYLLNEKPYVDIDFLGFTGNFVGTALGPGGAAWEYVGNQGGSIERFQIDKAGFMGNFILSLQSRFTRERRIDAKVVTGGNGVSFTLDPILNGLTYETNILGGQYFAKVFGPAVPEPATLVIVMGLGIVGLGIRRRRVP